jgi:hypothetical protein
MPKLRAFGHHAMITGAELIEGRELGAAVDQLLADFAAAYVHIHYAKYGCYACKIWVLCSAR